MNRSSLLFSLFKKKGDESESLYMKKSERAIGSTVYEKERKSYLLYMKKSKRAKERFAHFCQKASDSYEKPKSEG